MSPESFTRDVFLSHSAKDKAVRAPSLSASNGERAGVRCRNLHLAEPLRKDGRRNDSQSPTLNPQPLGGSDWAQLRLTHSQLSTLNPQPTGDPLNQERRFIPLRLDCAGLGRRRFIVLRDPRDAKKEILVTLNGENA